MMKIFLCRFVSFCVVWILYPWCILSLSQMINWFHIWTETFYNTCWIEFLVWFKTKIWFIFDIVISLSFLLPLLCGLLASKNDKPHTIYRHRQNIGIIGYVVLLQLLRQLLLKSLYMMHNELGVPRVPPGS